MTKNWLALSLALLSSLFFSACGESSESPSTHSNGDGDCRGSGCTCAPGFELCAGTCVATATNPAHCGACGVPCDSGLVCSRGTCTDSCATSETQCENSCVDTLTDVANCGGCDLPCAPGSSCSAGVCTCTGGQTSCGGTCTDTSADPANCGTCGTSCGASACTNGVCDEPAGVGGGTDGMGTGGVGTGGDGASAGGAAGGNGTGGMSMGVGGTPGACDPGTTQTVWATDCRSTPHDCVAGTWTDGGPEPTNSSLVYQAESEHFVIYRMSHISLNTSTVNTALAFMEDEIWDTYFGDPMYMEEPYCTSATKYKNVIHIRDDVGLQGGSWGSGGGARMGMWVGPGALQDAWGLAHEFMHGVQSLSGGMSCGGGSNYCGWWFESHANWAAHQVNDDNVHCTELFVNATHLHLGNLRNRYCNWQFAEFLKDKYCYEAVNEIWTEGQSNDPFSQIMTHMGWGVEEMNDFLGEWAMHNITWDYKDPPPTAGESKQSTFKNSYGDIDSTGTSYNNRGERRQRKTRLESLDDSWETNRRFVTNYYAAPQRWGYNIVELFPDSGVEEVAVTFKGVVQSGADSGWRYGLVATDGDLTTARYGNLQVGSGTESTASLCVSPGERVWLIVLAAPTSQIQINWDDHNYPNLHRYPWMVQLSGAWPAGFEGGTKSCAEGSPHANGGGCVAPGIAVAASAYVGPYAQVLGGTVSENARIEDHAIILSGSVTDSAVVGGLTILSSNFNVSGSAVVRSTFTPISWFGASSASGTAELLGDLEIYSSKSSGTFTGFVDDSSASVPLDEVTVAPPYSWD